MVAMVPMEAEQEVTGPIVEARMAMPALLLVAVAAEAVHPATMATAQEEPEPQAR